MCVTRTRKRSGLQTKVDIRELCGAPVSALLAQTWVALYGRLRILDAESRESRVELAQPRVERGADGVHVRLDHRRRAVQRF